MANPSMTVYACTHGYLKYRSSPRKTWQYLLMPDGQISWIDNLTFTSSSISFEQKFRANADEYENENENNEQQQQQAPFFGFSVKLLPSNFKVVNACHYGSDIAVDVKLSEHYQAELRRFGYEKGGLEVPLAMLFEGFVGQQPQELKLVLNMMDVASTMHAAVLRCLQVAYLGKGRCVPVTASASASAAVVVGGLSQNGVASSSAVETPNLGRSVNPIHHLRLTLRPIAPDVPQMRTEMVARHLKRQERAENLKRKAQAKIEVVEKILDEALGKIEMEEAQDQAETQWTIERLG